ncbi:MAG TPA: nuclear transport factor 2 family protein [Thermoleophilaceae bacterium]|nr:nuclear transport factor 2 family protein [Thermoleophilaceae bacterium]
MPTTVETLTLAYQAFKDGDAEALIAVSDPEIEFGTSTAARGGTYRGHPGVRRYLKEIEAAFGDRWDAEVERVAEAGDGRAVVIARIFGRGRADEPVEFRVAQIWELRDGKLLRGKVYADPREALDALDAVPGG